MTRQPVGTSSCNIPRRRHSIDPRGGVIDHARRAGNAEEDGKRPPGSRWPWPPLSCRQSAARVRAAPRRPLRPARRPLIHTTAAVGPRAVSTVAAIPFASPDGVELAVDVFHVDGESNRPAVVLLGPAGWSRSSRRDRRRSRAGTRPAGFGGLVVAELRVVLSTDSRACADTTTLRRMADVQSPIRFSRGGHGVEYGARRGPASASSGSARGPNWPSWPLSRRRGRHDPAPASRVVHDTDVVREARVPAGCRPHRQVPRLRVRRLPGPVA